MGCGVTGASRYADVAHFCAVEIEGGASLGP